MNKIRGIRNLFVLAVICFLLFAKNGYCQESTKRFVLDNGMIVLISEMPASPVVSVQALIKTGSATEGKYLGCGISHFIEHMLFKGTEKRPVGQISKEVKALGGTINASTSFDYTFYTLELPAGSFKNGLDILSDMLMNSTFDPKEVGRERDVIFGEMRLYRDNPDRYLNDLIFKSVYVKHPYQHPIIGYEPLFKLITRDELFDYYRTTYIPNNIILTIAGDVNAQSILPDIKAVFENFSPKAYLLRNLPQEPPQLSMRRMEEEYPTELTRLSIIFKGVDMLDDDMLPLDVLSKILSSGESSRFYQEILKRKNLVYSIDTTNFTPVDQGVFEISCTLDEENVEKTIAAIKDEIEKIKKAGVSKAELEKAKRQTLSQYVFGRQQASDVSSETAFNEAFTGDFNFAKKYVDAVGEVTSDSIKNAAQTYFTDSAMNIFVLRPKKETTPSEIQTPQKPLPEIKKVTLDNGLTILLREDHAFPLVSIRLALQGGLRAESENLTGISNLMSGLWTKGTASRTARQISESVESLGASFGGFSGQNSFGATFEGLSQDVDFALELLNDIIRHPAFPNEELSQDKERVKAAIIARDDNILTSTSLKLKGKLFEGHPYRLDPLGSLGTVEKIKREDIVRFYQSLCVPQNMVLAVFGDFDSEEMLVKIKKQFSSFEKREFVLPSLNVVAVNKMQEEENHLDKKQAMVMVGFQGAKLSNRDRFGLEILDAILGSPLSGRLFSEIRDKLGLSYTLGGNTIPGIETGFIYFYVATTDENAAKVKEALLNQIQALQIGDISDEEILNAKTYLKGTYQMSLETNAALCSVVTFDELYGLGFDAYKRYQAEINAFTKDDLKRLAQNYLNLSKAVVVITRPSKVDPTSRAER